MLTKTAKKFVAILLSMILSASVFIIPGIFAGAADAPEISWSFDSETGRLTISGNGPMEDMISLEFDPNNHWYNHAENIKEVYIEEGITSISQFAFSGYENIKKVTIPSTVKTIGMQSFVNCTKIESIAIPDGVVEIESNAFSYCSIKTVSIGKDLTDLDLSAFSYCKSLESFEVSPENPVFSSEDGVLFNKDKTKLIQYPVGNKRSAYTVPEGVKIIGKESFMDASALQEINLSDSVIQIDGNPFGGTGFFNNEENWENEELYINDKYLIFAGLNEFISGAYEVKEGTKVIAGCAFMNCDLTSISIPASVVSVGESALRCPNLSKIIVAEDSKYLTSVENVLFTKDMSELVCYPAAKEETSYVIPSGVKKIANYAFALSALNKIVFPEGLTEIGEFAFISSYNIKNITLPDSLVSVGHGAFYYLNIETVNFGKNLQTVGDYAFCVCNKLSSLDFPEGISKIGEYSFYSCVNLESVYIPDSIKEIDRMAFTNCGIKNLTVGITKEALNDLYSVKPSEAVIGSYAFNGCVNLTSAIVNAEIIEDCAFAVCNALETLTLFDSLKSIGLAAFVECNNINDIYYYGSESDWNNTLISKYNQNYLDGTFHYFYNEDTNKDIIIRYPADCFDEEVTFSVGDLGGTLAEIGGGIYKREGYKNLGLYTVKPLNSKGEIIQPKNGKVEIRLPFTGTYNENKEYAVYHLFENVVREKFTTNPKKASDKLLRIIDGYYVIEVDHFSEFLICIKEDEPVTPEKTKITTVSISSLPTKTSYTYKIDTLDLSGLELTVTYSDGTTEAVTDTSKMNVTGFDNTKIGEQIVSVEYEGFMAKFTVKTNYAWWQWIIRILLLGFLWY